MWLVNFFKELCDGKLSCPVLIRKLPSVTRLLIQSDCSRDFKQVEYAFFGQLRAWVFRRKSKGLRSRTAIKEKYFPPNVETTFNGSTHKGNWIFTGQIYKPDGIKETVNLIYPSWVLSGTYIKVEGYKSPFDGDLTYWLNRTQPREISKNREKKII